MCGEYCSPALTSTLPDFLFCLNMYCNIHYGYIHTYRVIFSASMISVYRCISFLKYIYFNIPSRNSNTPYRNIINHISSNCKRIQYRPIMIDGNVGITYNIIDGRYLIRLSATIHSIIISIIVLRLKSVSKLRLNNGFIIDFNF